MNDKTAELLLTKYELLKTLTEKQRIALRKMENIAGKLVNKYTDKTELTNVLLKQHIANINYVKENF